MYKSKPDNSLFPKNAPLCDLARKYHTDKITFGYTRIYDYYLSPVRKDVLNVFEIGIKDGKSLRMWRDYFWNADIYGMDIKNCSKHNEKRIHTFIGNQGKEEDLKSLTAKHGVFYDLIVDDGSHMQPDILTSFNTLFDYVYPGGYYIIEDVWSLVDSRGILKLRMEWGVKRKDFSDSVTVVMRDLENENIDFIHIYYAYKYPLTKLGTSNFIVIKKKG